MVDRQEHFSPEFDEYLVHIEAHLRVNPVLSQSLEAVRAGEITEQDFRNASYFLIEAAQRHPSVSQQTDMSRMMQQEAVEAQKRWKKDTLENLFQTCSGISKAQFLPYLESMNESTFHLPLVRVPKGSMYTDSVGTSYFSSSLRSLKLNPKVGDAVYLRGPNVLIIIATSPPPAYKMKILYWDLAGYTDDENIIARC